MYAWCTGVCIYVHMLKNSILRSKNNKNKKPPPSNVHMELAMFLLIHIYHCLWKIYARDTDHVLTTPIKSADNGTQLYQGLFREAS